MPRARPPTSGYARLAQEEEEEEYLDDSDQDDPKLFNGPLSNPGISYAPIQPKPRQERMQTSGRASPSTRRSNLSTRPRRSNSGIDIKAINARLERWADEIASKFKIRRKGKGAEDEQLEIQHSVFQAPDWIRPATAEELITVYTDPPRTRMPKPEFEDIVESVRVAIEMSVHPKLISQGSSGSYFAKNSNGDTVAVFKPKDEEPYASRNPKWTKWIHRNLFPCFFGRAMLIPNLSYISEAAAYVLDVQLRTNLVPYTDVVSLSSPSFFYDFWDRRAYYRKKKPLPEKLGSFQIFLRGYKDATKFLKEYPWPDQHGSSYIDAPRRKKRRWADNCRPTGAPSDDDEEDDEEATAEEAIHRRVFWTDALQQSFREELEKLVILDYIMRNTDRGLDNWMIRMDEKAQRANILIDPSKSSSSSHTNSQEMNGRANVTEEPYQRQEQMTATSRSATPAQSSPERIVRIGAIDNSLSWPWKHPDAVRCTRILIKDNTYNIQWRSYPFGWLFLPVSLIGQPFSESTRRHFLPLLTSKAWWSETQMALKQCFSMDADFQEKMFARQIAVMKGQAWNVVETLKTPDHGPLELTRRARVLVWDDVVEVPVAVPLRVSSLETRRREERRIQEAHEEMDISTVLASASQPQHDILSIGSPRPDFAPVSGSPFNVSRQSAQIDARVSLELNGGPFSPDNISLIADGSPSKKDRGYLESRPRPRPQINYEEPRRFRETLGSRSNRRLSLSARANMTSFPLTEDDLGDLGYAAAEDREGNRKRVIVERLEPVKSKNPVFTCC